MKCDEILMSDKESVDYAVEKTLFSKNIRRSIQLRLAFLQILAIFLVIYLVTLPIFNYLDILVSFPSITNREESFVNAVFILISFVSLILIIFILKSKPSIGTFLFIFIIIMLILNEINPFWLSFKFCAALFFYELPIIIHYYGDMFKGYQTYSSLQITELNHLRILLDKHVGFLLSMTAIMLSGSWFLIILSDRIVLNLLGDEAGVTFPLLILIFITVIAYFRSDISKSMLNIQTGGKKTSKES